MKKDAIDSKILETLGKSSLTAVQLTHIFYPNINNLYKFRDKNSFIRARLKILEDMSILEIKRNSRNGKIYSIPKGNFFIGEGTMLIENNGRKDKFTIGKTIAVKCKDRWTFLVP